MAKKEIDQYGDLNTRVRQLNATMSLVILVLLVGFITMLIGLISLIDSSNGNKQATYQQLVDKINSLKQTR